MENSFPGSSGGNAGRSFLFFLIRILPGMTALIPSAQDPGRLSARNHRNSLSGQECGTMIGRTFFCIVTGEQPETGRSGSYSNLMATRSRDQGARAFRKICLFSIPGRKFRYLIGARKKYKNAKLDKTLPKLCQKCILCLFSVVG